MAGGLFGKTSTVSDQFKGTNAGSDVKVGGNLVVTSDKDITLQGSDIAAKGKGFLDAKGNINVLDGLNEERSKSRTETETVFSSGTKSNDSTRG